MARCGVTGERHSFHDATLSFGEAFEVIQFEVDCGSHQTTNSKTGNWPAGNGLPGNW
jgi:hypothetical protein